MTNLRELANKAVSEIEQSGRKFNTDSVSDYVAEARYNGLRMTDREASEFRKAIIITWFYENF